MIVITLQSNKFEGLFILSRGPAACHAERRFLEDTVANSQQIVRHNTQYRLQNPSSTADDQEAEDETHNEFIAVHFSGSMPSRILPRPYRLGIPKYFIRIHLSFESFKPRDSGFTMV